MEERLGRASSQKKGRKFMNLKKSCFTAFMSCLSFILSTFISFPFVVPFQHFCNVICAVLLGPVYGFISAFITGCMRMLLTGRPVTALLGAVIGAFLAGLCYRLSGKMALAVLGEIVGTGLLSAIASYYAMRYGFGVTLNSPFYYIPLFMPACIVGSLLGYMVLLVLKRSGSLERLQNMLQ